MDNLLLLKEDFLVTLTKKKKKKTNSNRYLILKTKRLRKNMWLRVAKETKINKQKKGRPLE